MMRARNVGAWRARIVSLLALVALAGPAAAQTETPLNVGDAQAVTVRMDGDPRLKAIYARCPADAYRPQMSLTPSAIRERVSTGECSRSPTGCYEACASGRDGNACFHLGRAFQESEASISRRYAQMLFSMSCASGYGAGCTNRAASIRNALREGDPFFHASEAGKASCQFRSFRIACQLGDAWGCAMLGQSFQLGEGVRTSPARARVAFQKSCRLNPDFAACEFAREGMGELRKSR